MVPSKYGRRNYYIMFLTFSNQVCDTDLHVISPNVSQLLLFIALLKNEKSNPKDNRYSEKLNLHCYST